MWDDPIIAEIRTLREQVASRFDYDVLALGQYFKTKRAKDARKLILHVISKCDVISPRASKGTNGDCDNG